MNKWWFFKGSLLGYFKKHIHLQGRPLQHLEVSEWRKGTALWITQTRSFKWVSGTQDLPGPDLPAHLVSESPTCAQRGVIYLSGCELGVLMHSRITAQEPSRVWRSSRGPAVPAAGSPASVIQVHFLVLVSSACGSGPGAHGAEDACMGTELRCLSQTVSLLHWLPHSFSVTPVSF